MSRSSGMLTTAVMAEYLWSWLAKMNPSLTQLTQDNPTAHPTIGAANPTLPAIRGLVVNREGMRHRPELASPITTPQATPVATSNFIAPIKYLCSSRLLFFLDPMDARKDWAHWLKGSAARLPIMKMEMATWWEAAAMVPYEPTTIVMAT